MNVDTKETLNIPSNLDQAVAMILQNSNDEMMEQVKSYDSGKDFTAAAHHYYGRYLRNDWGLWDNQTEISRWFIERGIRHADDKSGIILEAVWCSVTKEKFDLNESINYYRSYWSEQGLDPDSDDLGIGL